jgi:hypothetical protein
VRSPCSRSGARAPWPFETGGLLIERAAGSEDAFDAAVSALVMGAHAAELETMPVLSDDVSRIEGKIWRPSP